MAVPAQGVAVVGVPPCVRWPTSSSGAPGVGTPRAGQSESVGIVTDERGCEAAASVVVATGARELIEDVETPSRGTPAKPAAAPGPRVDGELRAAWSRWTWAIGTGALAVRILVVLSQPLRLFSDDADYQRLAVSLATGHGWGVSHVASGGGPTAFRPPLFPLVLAGVYRVFGVHLLAARLFEAVLGGAAIVLLTVLTWVLWGRKVAVAAGVAGAVFPPMVMASTSLMSESVAVPLEIGSLLSMFVFRRTGHVRWAALGGVLLGLLVLTRTEAIVLAIPVVLLAIRGKRSHDRPPSESVAGSKRFGWRSVRASLAVLAATIVVLAPWEVRDRSVMKAWIPLTTQSGYVLAGTYNHTTATDPNYPAAWRPANYDPTDEKLIKDHPHADEVELDHLLETSAVSYVKEHPTYVVTVFHQNTLRLFDLAPQSYVSAATYSAYGFKGLWGYAEQVSALVALSLAAAGAVVLVVSRVRRGDRKGWVPLAYWTAPAILWISTVLQEAFPRLRALIDPFLLQLSAVALVALAVSMLRRFPALREAVGL